MATFIPDMNDIRNSKMVRPTEGELALLEELSKLPDAYQVYFQPHINFAHPDIIILHETAGAMIIEVKDWNLAAYSYYSDKDDYGYSKKDDYGYLKVKNESGRIATPFQQVQEYKDEFYNTFCPELITEKINRNSKDGNGDRVYGVIKTAVYFHKATANAVDELFGSSGHLSINKEEIKTYKIYTSYWCSEDLQSITSDIKERLLKKEHQYFTQPIYNSMQALLVPSESWAEQMTPFELDAKQKQFAKCTPGAKTRLKGIAGSGKTLVVAQKAINCYNRKKTPVLILTYNITLRNYIRDRIAQNTRGMSQTERGDAFEIIHYDKFLPQVIRKMHLKSPTPGERLDGIIDWRGYREECRRILENNRNRIKEYGCKYDTILIDEAQDYESEWFDTIQKYFLADKAEFFVVADEKQNVYERRLEDKLPVIPGFSGPWSQLLKSYRLAQTNFALAADYQKTFMGNKYNLNLDETASASTQKGSVRYFDLRSSDYRYGETWQIANQFRMSEPASPNDICILFNDMRSVRKMEQTISWSNPGIKVVTMCEKQQEYNKIKAQYDALKNEWNSLINQRYYKITESFGDNLDKIRKQIKYIRNNWGDISNDPNCDSEKLLKIRKKLYGVIEDLEQLRQMRKYQFEMNSGVIKICTIQSFKGWEISTVVFVLENETINDELVYTAITRAKKNIIVVNWGNEKYHTFFAEHDNAPREQKKAYAEIDPEELPF